MYSTVVAKLENVCTEHCVLKNEDTLLFNYIIA